MPLWVECDCIRLHGGDLTARVERSQGVEAGSRGYVCMISGSWWHSGSGSNILLISFGREFSRCDDI